MNPILNVPGLGGYVAAQQNNQAQTVGNLQQAQMVMGLQDAMAKKQRQAAYLQEVQALGPNASTDQLSAVVARYNPEKGLDIRQRAEDRKEAMAERARQFSETIALRQQGLDQQREAFLQRTADAQARQQFEESYKRQTLVLQQQQAAVNAEMRRQGLDIQRQGLEIQQQGNEIRREVAANRPITEFQGKNALYGSRAAMSDRTLNELEENISLVGLATKESLQNTPVVGGVLGAVANKALSADQQKVEQAQRNFVNAVLRQESGAVISAQEFDNAKKQYFPQPGDTKEVIAQKRANRKAAIAGFQRIAGPAWASVEEQLKQSTIPASTPQSSGGVIDYGRLP